LALIGVFLLSSAGVGVRRIPLAARAVHRQREAAGIAARCRWRPTMKTLFALGVWCLLFVLCWPLAILALVAWPLVWLLSLPFRLVGITFSALFAFLRALFMLPARLLGGGPVAA
jgi:hypothetical protein